MTIKTCSACKKELSIRDFHKHAGEKDGLDYSCKACIKVQHRTKQNVVTRIYAAQKSNSKRRHHLPPEYSREEFSVWLLWQAKFHALCDEWVASGYKNNLRHSVDRLHDYLPYSFDNIQLMTAGENNRKKRDGYILSAGEKEITQYDPNGIAVNHYKSITFAAMCAKISIASISHCCTGYAKSAGGYIWKYKQQQLGEI